MADGYTRVNNGKRIGVCAVQQGPGVENTFGGVAQTFSDSSPVLVFPGGPPQSRQASLPTFDPVPNFQHVSKWAARINQAGRIPEFLRRAFTYLRMGRPGPVVLELPQDVALADLEDPTGVYQPVQPARAVGNPQGMREALKAVLAAKKPLLHAGLGVLYSEAWAELKEFAELMQIPVMTTLPGKSCFPESHPLSLGCGGLSGSKVVAQFLSECDLILAVGSSLSISYFAAPIPPGKIVIQLRLTSET
jgi:acetolactate synthase-1/2/3 large subunit